MASRIQMVNPASQRVRIGFQGFSWTCLFFGPFPALFRGHFVGFFGMLIAAIFTSGLSGLVFMFLYNRWHYGWLQDKGYTPAGLAFSGMPAHATAINMPVQHVINVSVGNVGTVGHPIPTYGAIESAPQSPEIGFNAGTPLLQKP